MSTNGEELDNNYLPPGMVEEAFNQFMDRLGTSINMTLNGPDGKKVGFALFVFDSVESSKDVRYMSNCSREISVTNIRPFVEKNIKNRLKRHAQVTTLKKIK